MIAILAVLAGASVAHAQYPPSQRPTLVVSQDKGPPGYTFTATVANCAPGQRIVFVLGDQRVEATCDSVTLQASATFTAPVGIGSYTVSAEFYGDCSSFVQRDRPGAVVSQAGEPCLVLSTTIQVVGEGAATPTTLPSGNIATTGSNGVNSTLTTALILVLAGLGVLMVTRLRRRQDNI